MQETIAQGLAQLGLSTDAAPALAEYGRLLAEKNKVMNLTAITEPTDIARLHFLDCAALLNCLPFQGRSVIDVGSGAGFPGLVLKLIEPSLSLTLLDSLGKRVSWLEEISEKLDVPDVRCVHARGEEQSLLPGWRDSFDIVTSRAVAELRLLCELCLPFVKVGGHFLAMKGPGCQEELFSAARAIATLGGFLCPSYEYVIPGTDIRRQVVIIQKTSPTPKGYPRRFAKIQKSPL